MDDNMLLVTGIGILSALLVYQGVRLFMFLFKKCEQNRKHQVIFIMILLFITAILCGAMYLLCDLYFEHIHDRYVSLRRLFLKDPLLFPILFSLLLFVISFILSCFISFIALLIRKKVYSITFLLCGILPWIVIMIHPTGKMILFSEKCRHCGINPRSYCERIITSHCIECHKAYQQRAHCSAINVHYSAGVEGKCPECVSEWMHQKHREQRGYDTSTER